MSDSYADSTNAWWDLQVANFSQNIAPELAGNTLLSFETGAGNIEECLTSYAQANPVHFFRYLRMLDPQDQVVILTYYLLSKNQSQIAVFADSTQTIISFRLRLLVRCLVGYLNWGGEPSVELIHEVLTKASLEYIEKGIRVSDLVDSYRRTRDFVHVANAFGLHRPDVRRHIRRVGKILSKIEDFAMPLEVTDPDNGTLGAYLFLMMDRTANLRGQKDRPEVHEDIIRTDPDCLGDFRIKIEDAGFDSVFVSRANF